MKVCDGVRVKCGSTVQFSLVLRAVPTSFLLV